MVLHGVHGVKCPSLGPGRGVFVDDRRVVKGEKEGGVGYLVHLAWSAGAKGVGCNIHQHHRHQFARQRTGLNGSAVGDAQIRIDLGAHRQAPIRLWALSDHWDTSPYSPPPRAPPAVLRQ